jgi:hypothetical protein
MPGGARPRQACAPARGILPDLADSWQVNLRGAEVWGDFEIVCNRPLPSLQKRKPRGGFGPAPSHLLAVIRRRQPSRRGSAGDREPPWPQPTDRERGRPVGAGEEVSRTSACSGGRNGGPAAERVEHGQRHTVVPGDA